MSLRIISGQFKGRILKTPKGSATRPTQEIVRGAVFNICQQEIQGALFLDLFAGSGSMGLEALSRGAKHATLIEKNRNALAAIRENIINLHVESQTTVMQCDAIVALERLTSPFNIVYIDPPYTLSAKVFVEQLLQRNLLCPQGLLFLEERDQRAPPLFPTLALLGSRRFGDTVLHHFLYSK